MFQVEIHQYIEIIISIFHRFDVWSSEDEETIGKLRIKIFYSVYYIFSIISMMAGAITSDNKGDSIFLIESSLVMTVLFVKLLCLIWQKQKIIELLNQICSYSVKDQDEFTLVINKLKYLMNFVALFYSSAIVSSVCALLVPGLFGSERKLFFSIGFPLDWRNNDFAYWLTVAFLSSEFSFTIFSWLFTGMIWYLLANCSLRYRILGKQIKDMGKVAPVDETTNKMEVSNIEKDNIYLRDLLVTIKSYNYLNEYKSWSITKFSKILFFFHLG